MTRTLDAATSLHLSAGGGWRRFRNLLGGALILAVWLSLWAWVALGVAGPVARAAAAAGPAAVVASA